MQDEDSTTIPTATQLAPLLDEVVTHIWSEGEDQKHALYAALISIGVIAFNRNDAEAALH